jgi:L-ascorbate metabolism protein UlaG (beta-lactamase superfamily)
MTIPLQSLADMLRNPRARHQNDQSTATELATGTSRVQLPPGLRLQWLGTSGFRLSYAGFDLLIDPYLSRPSLSEVLAPRALRWRTQRLDAVIDRADAILVGHTHFDHAMDVPYLATRHNAQVYGSESLTRLMALHGASERAHRVSSGEVIEIGPFAVTFVPSEHSKLMLGLAVQSGGELTCDHLDHLTGNAYRCGQVYGIHIAVAGFTLYHQGSANLIDDAIVHRDVDVFLMGIAGRGFTRDYTQRVLRRLQPRVIIPHHYDDFFRPIDAPFRFSLNVNLGGFVDEVARVSHDFHLASPAPLQWIGDRQAAANR